MPRYFLAITLSIIFCSCGSTYYYAQIESTDPYTEKNDRHKFITKSDSLEIAYSFNGENAPLNIEVFSKMRQNLFIDWYNSYFIFGDDANNRTNLEQFIDPDLTMQQVAPFEETETRLFELSNLQLDKIKDKHFKTEGVEVSENTVIGLDVANFNEENTPLYMRSFLAIRVGSKNTNPIIYQQDFYINRIIKTGIPPSEIMHTRRSWADHFYTRKENGKAFKNILSTTGLVLLTASVVAVSIALPDEEQ